MKFIFLLFLISTLFSCNKKQDKDSMKDSLNSRPVIFFSGKPEIPQHINEITSAGMGNILLGDSLNSIINYPDSIENITLYKSGAEWPAKKIKIKNSEWVIAESINSVNQITAIYTNSAAYKTKKHYFIGMPLDSINFNQDSLFIDQENKAFFLYGSGIWFKIDPFAEKKFFKSKQINTNNFGKATIHEFFIVCGDC
jgi:hypothetical protein